MITSIPKSDILKYCLRQIENMFPDGEKYVESSILPSFNHSLERLEYCFSKINSKYYFVDGKVIFNHLNGDQFSMFLYFFSNTLYKDNFSISLCSKLFLLNKSFFGIDVFYEVELPKIFLFVHPLGTIIGRGHFNDYLVIYQGCSVGANDNIYPEIGHHVTLRPHSSVLGNSKIGNHCQLAANSLIIGKHLKDGTTYYGNPKSNFEIQHFHTNNIWFNDVD